MDVIEIVNKKLELLYTWQTKRNTLDDQVKNDLDSQISAWRRIKEELEFQLLSSSEKQARRIGNLASCRKSGWNCDKELMAIRVYDMIIVTLPYLKALNQVNKLSLLEDLCMKELDLIDGELGDVKKHVSLIEIEEAFKVYFETVYPYKMNMFEECYEKIETLYEELLRVAE